MTLEERGPPGLLLLTYNFVFRPSVPKAQGREVRPRRATERKVSVPSRGLVVETLPGFVTPPSTPKRIIREGVRSPKVIVFH